MALTAYLDQTRRLLHDSSAQFYSTADLTAYINLARGQIASEGECVRVLTPIAASIASIAVTAGGSGYSATPTVAIVGTGTGATATATVLAGVITGITVTAGGSNYQQPATVTITDPTGTGAAATATINNINVTVVAQEVYTYASRNALVALTAGVQSILKVFSVAVSWGTLKPSLRRWSWNDFQAYFRSYNTQLQNWPSDFAQYGQGANGSLYLFPRPSQITSMEWDCACLPVDLVTDGTAEAIPYPWTDCIPFYGAHYALASAQRQAGADMMLKKAESFVKKARAYSEAPFVPDYYSGL